MYSLSSKRVTPQGLGTAGTLKHINALYTRSTALCLLYAVLLPALCTPVCCDEVTYCPSCLRHLLQCSVMRSSSAHLATIVEPRASSGHHVLKVGRRTCNFIGVVCQQPVHTGSTRAQNSTHAHILNSADIEAYVCACALSHYVSRTRVYVCTCVRISATMHMGTQYKLLQQQFQRTHIVHTITATCVWRDCSCGPSSPG